MLAIQAGMVLNQCYIILFEKLRLKSTEIP